MSSDENRPPDSAAPTVPATDATEIAVPPNPTVVDAAARTEADLDATRVGRPPAAAKPALSAETPLDDAATLAAPPGWAPPGRAPQGQAPRPPAPPATPPPAPPVAPWQAAQPSTPPPWPGAAGPSPDPSHYPGPGYPQQGYPGQPPPGLSYPGPGYPQQGYPQQGYPQQGYPGQGQPAQSQAPASPAIPAYPGTPAPGASGLPLGGMPPAGMPPEAAGGTGAMPTVPPAPGTAPTHKRSGLTIALLLVTILLGISVLGTGGWWVATAGSKNSEVASLKRDHQAYLKQKKEAEDAETARFAAADLSGKFATVRQNNDALIALYAKSNRNYQSMSPAEQIKVLYGLRESAATCTESIVAYNQAAASFPQDKLGSLPDQVDMNDPRYSCQVSNWHA